MITIILRRFYKKIQKVAFSIFSMNDSKPKWYPTPKNGKLILDFILWFSRLEFAMKSTPGFYKPNPLSPNWQSIYQLLINQQIPQSLSNTIIYLRENPPNIQADVEDWQPIPNNTDWVLLIKSLKTVRNNLFHGGKHVGGRILQEERDVLLLTHGLLIIKEIVKAAPEQIQVFFEGA